MAGQLQTFLDAMVTKLEGVSPTKRGTAGEQGLTTPPRFVWERLNPRRVNGQRMGGGTNPPTLGAKFEVFKVEAWGRDLDDLENMEAALLTALDEVRGRLKYELDYADVVDVKTGQFGTMTVFVVSVLFEIPRARLLTTPIGAGGTPPKTTVSSATVPTVAVSDVAEESGGVAGDGILEPGEIS